LSQDGSYDHYDACRQHKSPEEEQKTTEREGDRE